MLHSRCYKTCIVIIKATQLFKVVDNAILIVIDSQGEGGQLYLVASSLNILFLW